jgi:hypothetical protein
MRAPMMAMPTMGPTTAPAIQALLAAGAGELVGDGGAVVVIGDVMPELPEVVGDGVGLVLVVVGAMNLS